MESLFPNLVREKPRGPSGPRRYLWVALERGIERAGSLARQTHPSAGKPGSVAIPATPALPVEPGTLTYFTADPNVQPGDRVRVPLGRGDASTAGIVVRIGGDELLAGLSAARVKPISERLGPVVTAELLDLARWMAAYYVCPLGMVLASLVPAAVKKQTGLKRTRVLSLAAPTAEVPRLTRVQAGALDRLRSLDASCWPMTIDGLVAACRDATAEGSPPPVSAGTVRRLMALGLLTAVERLEVPAVAAPEGGGQGLGEPTGLPTLTRDQQSTVNAIGASLGAFGVHLIRGVTGSGKTEVYLRLIDMIIRQGKRAIVLAPEIALTPQTSRRFLLRFGASEVAVLHSALSSGQRHAHWAACAAGRVRVVVGARSAVFAPLPDLGIIVVDEEHDSSYKQDQLPRYHARDVAIKRAQGLGCPVVLGSATPSLESWANARGATPPLKPGSTHRGEGLRLVGTETASPPAKYTLHTLPTRATGAALPRVEIVDLALERKRRAQEGGWRDQHLNLLGPTLERALGETLRAGDQAMLLLNRRGYANYISCPDQRCGWAMRCEQCDATMVYHLLGTPGRPRSRDQGYLRCHHCLAENVRPSVCPQCQRKVNTVGLGT
ncbi:MAG: primosomal protein N', partial [Phycisphaerales bacterium]